MEKAFLKRAAGASFDALLVLLAYSALLLPWQGCAAGAALFLLILPVPARPGEEGPFSGAVFRAVAVLAVLVLSTASVEGWVSGRDSAMTFSPGAVAAAVLLILGALLALSRISGGGGPVFPDSRGLKRRLLALFGMVALAGVWSFGWLIFNYYFAGDVFRSGNHSRAAATLRTVVFYNRNLKVVPVEIGTRKMLAEAAEKSGDFALAIDSLKVLAELDPANGAAYGERIAALEGKTGR